MLGVIALWSVVPVLIKLLLDVLDPFTIAFVRLGQGAAVVLAVFFARGHRLQDIHWSWWHLVGGLGIGLNFATFALSLSYTTASAGVLVIQVQYVTLAVLAAVVLHERLGPSKIAGMAFVLIGVAVVVGVRADAVLLLAPRYALGNTLMLFSGLGWGLYALANKALAARLGTSAILAPMLCIATAITGALAATHFQFHARPTAGTLAAVLALGVLATGGAFILVSEAIKRLSAALVGTATAIAPIGQIALAHWLLAEPLTGGLLGGGALILGGVFTMVYAEKSQARQRNGEGYRLKL